MTTCVKETTTKAIEYEGEIKKQKYEQVKKDCLKKKIQFEDELFASRELSSKLPASQFTWQRPGQTVTRAQFIAGTISETMVDQGRLADAWFISALSTMICSRSQLLEKVAPMQSLTEDYAGIFNFNFYQNGKPISVVVDDLIPISNAMKLPAFARSSNRNEFWVCLVEKAYAKLKSSYESLAFTSVSEVLCDFTGGVPEYYRFKKEKSATKSAKADAASPETFAFMLYQSVLRNALVCLVIEGDKGEKPKTLPNGLNTMETYSVTGMVRVCNKKEPFYLVRLKNPWLNCDWKGAWSKDSAEWKAVSEEDKTKIGLTMEDGEFWIRYEDMISHFNAIDMCHLPKELTDEDSYRWLSLEFHGEWIKGESAGGPASQKETFPTNPKFQITIGGADVEWPTKDGLITVVVSLQQKYYRFRKLKNNEDVKIGFVLYAISKEGNKLGATLTGEPIKEFDSSFFRTNPIAAKVDYLNKQDVTGRFRLKPGKYLLIPTTYQKDHELSFMLRVLVAKSDDTRKTYKIDK